ncbi:hypothetical protein [Mucilaginibacter antarcticus]|uniref:hypothetical protein n=1 Tax=Mucilaginibacter antarcticus TaxID=1855725 RepID=UPI0036379847
MSRVALPFPGLGILLLLNFLPAITSSQTKVWLKCSYIAVRIYGTINTPTMDLKTFTNFPFISSWLQYCLALSPLVLW